MQLHKFTTASRIILHSNLFVFGYQKENTVCKLIIYQPKGLVLRNTSSKDSSVYFEVVVRGAAFHCGLNY